MPDANDANCPSWAQKPRGKGESEGGKGIEAAKCRAAAAMATCSRLQEISEQVPLSGCWDICEALRRTCLRPRRRRPPRCRRRCRRWRQADIPGMPWSPDVCLANFTPTSRAASFCFPPWFRKFCPLQDTARPAWMIAIGRRRSRLISPGHPVLDFLRVPATMDSSRGYRPVSHCAASSWRASRFPQPVFPGPQPV